MSNLVSKIAEALLRNKCVAIVAPSNSGKTYWVKHELIPFLEQYKKVVIFESGEVIRNEQADIFIFDEAETLIDRHFFRRKASRGISLLLSEIP